MGTNNGRGAGNKGGEGTENQGGSSKGTKDIMKVRRQVEGAGKRCAGRVNITR